jgi:hypothetical protein
MKKLLALLLFCSSYFLTHAQDPATQASRVAIGVSAGPNLGTYPKLNLIYQQRDNPSTVMTGFSINLPVQFALDKAARFQMGTGISYTSLGHAYEADTFYLEYYDGSIVFDTMIGTFRYQDRYLEIPLRLSYHIHRASWGMYAFGGLIGGIYLNSTSFLKQVDLQGNISTNRNGFRNNAFKPLALSGMAGVGFELNLSKRLLLQMEAYMRQGIIPPGNGTYKGTHIAGGLNIGIMYQLPSR